MKKCVVTHGSQYQATKEALEYLSENIFKELKGKKNILIKPGLVGPRKLAGVDFQTMKAITDFFKETGLEVCVAEAGTFGTKLSFFMHKYKDLGVPIIDLNDEEFVEGFNVKTAHGQVQAEVSKRVLESDYLVSVMRLKTHNHAVVTGTIKNMMGSMRVKQRNAMHGGFNTGKNDEEFKLGALLLNYNIVKMSELLYPDFSVLDGVVGMEGNGPFFGTPKRANTVVAGDPITVDWVGAKIIGVEPSRVGYLELIRRKRRLAKITGRYKDFSFKLHKDLKKMWVNLGELEKLF